MLLFSVPNLSDDFYRFIWDGRLLASGYHPFAEVPSYYIEHNLSIPGINAELFEKLNSPDYFTIYPPAGSVYFLGIGETITPLHIRKCVCYETCHFFIRDRILADHQKTSVAIQTSGITGTTVCTQSFVILELTGNVHLEAVMIFFLLLSLLFLAPRKMDALAGPISMAIGVKLIPLIFLPALLPRLGWKKAFVYYTTSWCDDNCSCFFHFLIRVYSAWIPK